MEDSLNLRDRNLDSLKCALYAKKCHTQVVQVHLQPFRCNSLLKRVRQPEIAKNY